MDHETAQGLVTDVCLKRKVRDYVDASNQDQGKYKIYIQRESYLTETRARVFREQAPDRQEIHPSEAKQWMCQEFFDIRMFGAVMSITGELSLHRGTKAEARCLAAGNLQSAPPEDLRKLRNL